LFLVPSGYIIYSTNKDIYKTSIDTFKSSEAIKTFRQTNHAWFDIHYKSNRIIWYDEENEETGREFSSINSAHLNGTGYHMIMKVEFASVDSFAVDWMSDNVYIAFSKLNYIEVARLDGSYRKQLIFSKNLLNPRCVMVNPHLRYIHSKFKFEICFMFVFILSCTRNKQFTLLSPASTWARAQNCSSIAEPIKLLKYIFKRFD